MKSSKVLLNVSLVLIWILTLVAELLTGLIVWRLDLLPEKYMLILVVLLSVVSVVLGLMILLPRKRKKSGNLRCGAGCVRLMDRLILPPSRPMTITFTS